MPREYDSARIKVPYIILRYMLDPVRSSTMKLIGAKSLSLIIYTVWWFYVVANLIFPRSLSTTKNKGKGHWSVNQCDTVHGLSRSQRLLCKRYNTHMPFVASGAALGVRECQHQFSKEKWNCPTYSEDETVFGNILKTGKFYSSIIDGLQRKLI